ncbi:hypothetical protein HOP50_01g07250 [Chloropicon primus]|uniref:Leucine-rich repeat domain-containing protein n=1 Tax=Chloropicon primus TaxID=1764295 RepID=A0A5B8MCW8_9CHLO|nr:hypothetical protein A3770_01p07410 [Chloropicon primus]UPQ97434.1 hypothetical protein HOP50_01g07250 [Chloropicon primus]|eukprot:QDZ18223.1 hypothetical protein A3770_01p07410 [Chloropicon primus]
MTQANYNFGYAELSRAKQATKVSGKGKCEKLEAEKEFLQILEKNLYLEQRQEEDWGAGTDAKAFSLGDLEVEFSDYAGAKEDATQLSSLDALSTVLSQQPAAFKSERLSAVNKQVCVIDKLPGKYKATRVLLLSNNYIRNLGGLQQFRSLKTLSLSNNLVTSFGSLAGASKACECLENANFEGNQICKYPFYRSHILSYFPSLNVLDNCPVTDKERKFWKRDVSIARERIAEIVQNYCLTCFLTHVADLLSVHQGIRAKAGRAGGEARDPVTRASIRTLIGSWEKENHFCRGVLDQVEVHYNLEVSKVKHQMQYFCKKAGIKEDKSNLWVMAFEKILSRQEFVLKDLGCRIEQFAPLELKSPSLDLAKEITQGIQRGGANRFEKDVSRRRGRGNRHACAEATEAEHHENVPLARTHVPSPPISGKVRSSRDQNSRKGGDLGSVRDGLRHRDRSKLRFRPIERKSPSGEETSAGETQGGDVGQGLSPSTSEASVRSAGAPPPRALESKQVGPAPILRERQPLTPVRLDAVCSGVGGESAEKPLSAAESPLFQNIAVTEGLDPMEEVTTDFSVVEELRLTVEALDEEASTAVRTVNDAIDELNSDLDGMIAAQQSLEQEVIQKKLLENEAKSLLALQMKENAKLQESTRAIDSVLKANHELKFEVASLQQEYSDVLGQLRREKEKVESFEKEIKAFRDAERAAKRKEEFIESCKELSERSLGRRVFLRFFRRVRELQRQRKAFVQVQEDVFRRVKWETLICWSYVCRRTARMKEFIRRREDWQTRAMFEYWRDWSVDHRAKRLMMVDIHEKAKEILRRKVLFHWRGVAQAMVETQQKVAHTFREFWVRKKAYLAFCKVVERRRRSDYLEALAYRHRVERWFHLWCIWCSEKQEHRRMSEEADSFRAFWTKKRFFNKFLLLVVLNERRHISRLISLNHFVKQLQQRTLLVWRENVLLEQRKKVSADFAVQNYLWKALQSWKGYWADQIAKKARRKKLGVIGRMITSEKNAQIRSTYFFRWFAYTTKSASASKLESQELEHQEYIESERERERERERRASIAASSRRPSSFRGEPPVQRRQSAYAYGSAEPPLEDVGADMQSEREEMISFIPASRRPSSFRGEPPAVRRRQSAYAYGSAEVVGADIQSEREEMISTMRRLSRSPRLAPVANPKAESREAPLSFTPPPRPGLVEGFNTNAFPSSMHHQQQGLQNNSPLNSHLARSATSYDQSVGDLYTPPLQSMDSMRELVSLHAEISTLQNRILETLET